MAEAVVEVEQAQKAEGDLRSLGKVAISGTVWSVAAYGAAMCLRLFTNIVLSRILAPENFGLMSLLNTTITGLSLFSDIGLTPNIIRSRRGDEPEFLNTAWTIQVIRGAALWLICAIISLPFASFYREPQLKYLVPIIGLSLIATSFVSTSVSTLSRRMAVRQLALMDLGLYACQLVATVGWAYVDRSVWALVFGKLFADVMRVIVSYWIIPGQTNRFHWDHDAAREIFTLGRWVFLSTAFTFMAGQSDRLILGKLVSLPTLAMYGMAFALSDIPRQIIMTFRGFIVMPFVAKLVHLPREEFFTPLLKYRRTVLLVASALLAFVVTFGDLAMWRIYDSRYHGATWMVPILAFGLWQTILYTTTSPCLFVIGDSRNAAIGYGCSGVTILLLTPFAFYHWGLAGAVGAIAFSDFPAYLVNLYGLRREKMNPLAQDFTFTVVFLALVVSFAAFRISIGFPFPQIVNLH